MKPFRVLIADDDWVTRMVIDKTLCDLPDIELIQAKDGKETLAALANESLDLILLDWNMPGAAGIDILRDYRRSGSRVPVIMITAETDREHVQEALVNGASGYILKPFDRNYLWQKVQEMWQQHQDQE